MDTYSSDKYDKIISVQIGSDEIHPFISDCGQLHCFTAIALVRGKDSLYSSIKALH
jgi:hypothetical protein